MTDCRNRPGVSPSVALSTSSGSEIPAYVSISGNTVLFFSLPSNLYLFSPFPFVFILFSLSFVLFPSLFCFVEPEPHRARIRDQFIFQRPRRARAFNFLMRFITLHSFSLRLPSGSPFASPLRLPLSRALLTFAFDNIFISLLFSRPRCFHCNLINITANSIHFRAPSPLPLTLLHTHSLEFLSLSRNRWCFGASGVAV